MNQKILSDRFWSTEKLSSIRWHFHSGAAATPARSTSTSFASVRRAASCSACPPLRSRGSAASQCCPTGTSILATKRRVVKALICQNLIPTIVDPQFQCFVKHSELYLSPICSTLVNLQCTLPTYILLPL